MAKDLTEALRALTDKATSGQTSRVDKALPVRANPPAITARSGSAGPLEGAANTGIASPLTETAFSDRKFYSGGWKTADGLFTLPAIKTIKMKDAKDQTVIFEFQSPP